VTAEELRAVTVWVAPGTGVRKCAVATRNGMIGRLNVRNTVIREWQSDGVVLPSELERALESNTLVLFCGAGVSAAPPSSLPGFRGLVEEIATELGRSDLVPADSEVSVQFDAVMGELNELQHDVHARVSTRLRSSTQSNSYHQDLIQIAQSSSRAPRIVTTNFDLLFEDAARHFGVSFPLHIAPALPLGNDFSGLVHLHGVIDPSMGQRMVVTDADFGQAYITEGWATQFLTRMFEKYVTLFVGYSADDTVMRYLARALPANGKTRFAFMEAGQSDAVATRWARLGVTPIAYPSRQGAPHASLKSFIENWRKRLTATSAERFDRVQALLASGPEGDAIQEHELLWLIRDAEHARHFMNDANATEWIPRLDALNLLEGLFDDSVTDSDEGYAWARWAARSLANDDDAVLLAAVSRHEGHMSSGLWFHVWLHLYQGYQSNDQHRQWLLLLAADQHSRDNGRLSGLLRQVAEKDVPAAEVLLHQMLIPRLRFRPHRGWQSERDSLDSEMVLTWEESSVRDAWPTLLSGLEDPDRLLSVVLSLIGGAESTEYLFTGRGRGRGLSARRQTVDGVEQFGRNDPYVLVVDMGRDILREFVRTEGPGRARQLLNSPSELIRRLAIDALAEARTSEADALVEELIDRSLIFDVSSKPEVFRLLRAMYRHASPDRRLELVAHVNEAEQREGDVRIRDYERYNALVWISSDQSDDDPARIALRLAETVHPDYGPREHPDLNFSLTTGTFDQPVLKAEGFFRGKSVGQVVEVLAGDSSLDDRFGNAPLLRELGDYLEQHHGQELHLMDEFLEKEFASSAAWAAVLLSAVRPGLEWQAEPILRRLQQLSLPIEDIVFRVLFSITRPNNENEEALENAAERCRLLLGLWKNVTAESLDAPPMDPSQAHSTARGALAYAYVEAALRATQDRGDQFVDSELLNGFDELIAAQDANPVDPSPMMLARYSGYIVDMAPEWSDRQLRPRLSVFDNSPSSKSFWAGVLTSNRFSSSLMARTREALRTAWPVVAGSLPGSVEAFIEVHAAQFAFYTAAGEHTWADPFIAAAPVKTRTRWIRAVARHLDGDDSVFQTLLFAHWQHRLDGQPPLLGTEQRALLEWLMLPGLDLDQAVELFVRGPVVATRDEDHGFDYYDLDEFPRDNTTALLKVCLHLLRERTNLPPFLNLLVKAASEATDEDAELAQAIWGELLRLGYTQARTFLTPE
jgi:hypothetical protein